MTTETKENESTHQQLMDEAYKLFERNDNPIDEWGIEELFDHLDYVHRVAVALGNLNYQVGNGGFLQWHFNGYSKCHYDFLSRLNTKGYPQLTEALELMRKAYVALEGNDEDDDSSIVDECDTAFYKLEKLEDEMNEFIITLQKTN